MKKQAEKQVQSDILKYLKKQGCYVVKIIVANESGVSDILCCKDGHFISIEVKATGKKRNVSELQKLHLQRVKDAGGTAFVADSLSDVISELKIKEDKEDGKKR